MGILQYVTKEEQQRWSLSLECAAGLSGLSHELVQLLAHGFQSCRLAKRKRETHTVPEAHAATEPSTGSVASCPLTRNP